MPEESVFADPDEIRNLTGPYFTAADDFAGLRSRFHHLQLRYAAAFGDDEIGTAFVASFTEQHAVVRDGVEGTETVLRFLGTGLRSNADRYEETEEGAVVYSHALLTGMTGGVPARPARQVDEARLRDPVHSLEPRTEEKPR